jgi:hypothetical protein
LQVPLFVGDRVSHTHFVRRRLLACALAWLGVGCGGGEEDPEAGVGGSRDSCGAPGSHSEPLTLHSCACEPGYDWCSDALDDFDCCASAATDDDGGAPTPVEPCDASSLEQLLCVPDVDAPDDPAAAVVWACNGERWVEVTGYATFACKADHFQFGYGCTPGTRSGGPTFLCGYGPGSPCEIEGYPAVCVDEDIIDTCVWGRRTVDRCSRLCVELGAFGPGHTAGGCEQLDTNPATCVCA